MQYITFKTETNEVAYNMQGPDGKITTHKENIPIAVGVCPKCGAILFNQQGIIGETLHKIAYKQMGDSAAYCGNCGENYCVGPIIDGTCEVINVEKEEKDDSSGENANPSTENK